MQKGRNLGPREVGDNLPHHWSVCFVPFPSFLTSIQVYHAPRDPSPEAIMAELDGFTDAAHPAPNIQVWFTACTVMQR